MERSNEIGPRIDYSEIISNKDHVAHKIAYAALELRQNNGKITAGYNIAGYRVYDAQMNMVAEALGVSTGEGTRPNTHPDQKCLDQIVEKLICVSPSDRKPYNLSAPKTNKPSARQALSYKNELQEKMKQGELKIIFFSERAPCVRAGDMGCQTYLKNILGEEFVEKNVYYTVEYNKNDMQEEFESQLHEANKAYNELQLETAIASISSQTSLKRRASSDRNIDTNSSGMSTKKMKLKQDSAEDNVTIASPKKYKKTVSSSESSSDSEALAGKEKDKSTEYEQKSLDDSKSESSAEENKDDASLSKK